MQKLAAIFCLALFASAFICFAPVLAADEEQVIIYQTDFTTDPHWITNNPSYYYWDVGAGNYHFQTEGGTNGYSYIPIVYAGETFILEYDVSLTSIENDGAIRFGATSTEMDISRGTIVLGTFEDISAGNIMGLRVIDSSNHLSGVTSRYDSYCGQQPNCDTKQFALNSTYHVIIRYNNQGGQADIKISDQRNGSLVWGYFVSATGDLAALNRLAITTKGDYSTGNTARGSIDNVVMYTYRPVQPTVETTVPTTIPTTPPTTIPTTTPTPTPTKSPVGLFITIAAGALGGGCSIVLSKGKKDRFSGGAGSEADEQA